MEPVTQVSGRAYPFGRANIDTDIIIPAEYLKTTTREGLGKHAFETVRAEAGNVFDDPSYVGAPIVIAGDNFGCGSSREHAVWALADMGVSAVIAPGFSDIFSGNAFKNGVVTVALPSDKVDHLLAAARDGASLTVDLDTMTVTTDRQDRFPFALDPFRRDCLMTGQDEIGLTLQSDAAIAAYETRAPLPAPAPLESFANL